MAVELASLEASTLPILIGLILSFAQEQLSVPRPNIRCRPFGAWLLHIGIWLLCFALMLAILRRPLNAAANVLALQTLVVAVGLAKYHSLREPFVFQDFEYFTDALRHPRLYLPFFGLWRAILASVAITGAVFGGLILENPLADHLWAPDAILSVTAILLAGAIFILIGNRFPLPVTFDPVRDIQCLGQFASLWRYMQEERRPVHTDSLPNAFGQIPTLREKKLPDIVAIQSESFFDARRLFAGVRPDVLREFDRIKNDAFAAGQLEVPAWGANTVRSEFAFLFGLSEDALGVHRFNPYRKIARLGLPNLVNTLKRFGYQTACIHPYPASFYYREVVFPLLGFDDFIDLRAFSSTERFGPYIGDCAVAEKVKSLVTGNGKPLFVFVITMENHGPLHWEKVEAGDVERLYSATPPSGWDDFTIYLRHLVNADKMIGSLRQCLEASPREAIMCFLGDHVPILPKIYGALGYADASTDFFIWSSRPRAGGVSSKSRKIEHLSSLLLQLFEAHD